MNFTPTGSFRDTADMWKPTDNFEGLLYTLVAFNSKNQFTTRDVILSEEITDINDFIKKNREYLKKSNLNLAWIHIFTKNDTGISPGSWKKILSSPLFLINDEC